MPMSPVVAPRPSVMGQASRKQRHSGVGADCLQAKQAVGLQVLKAVKAPWMLIQRVLIHWHTVASRPPELSGLRPCDLVTHGDGGVVGQTCPAPPVWVSSLGPGTRDRKIGRAHV